MRNDWSEYKCSSLRRKGFKRWIDPKLLSDIEEYPVDYGGNLFRVAPEEIPLSISKNSKEDLSVAGERISEMSESRVSTFVKLVSNLVVTTYQRGQRH